MKVGDLVRVEGISGKINMKIGILLEISEPTPMFAYQVVTIAFNDGSCSEGIPANHIRVIN